MASPREIWANIFSGVHVSWIRLGENRHIQTDLHVLTNASTIKRSSSARARTMRARTYMRRQIRRVAMLIVTTIVAMNWPALLALPSKGGCP